MNPVVVIGAGLSGLVTALRLAEKGLPTTLVAHGVGATHLAPATIDVLGYAPDLVENPSQALPAFRAENPDHPYAHLSTETVAASISWFRERVPELRYTGSLEENILVPTAVGVPKPTGFVPDAMVAADLRAGGRFAFIGLRALKNFYPGYLADNLCQVKVPSGTGLEARSVQLAEPGREADVSPLDYARRFEDPSFRDEVVADLLPRLEPGEAVGFPAVLGLDAHPAVLQALRDRLERPVFEVPTVPPSVPGVRLYRALHVGLRRRGVRIMIGARVIGAETRDGAVDAVLVRNAANRSAALAGRSFVLATGGFTAGAISVDSLGEVRETVFGLPVAGVPATDAPRFLPNYFDDHPLAKSGLAVDDRFRPIDKEGRPVFDNLFAVGAVLGGAEPWREQTGNGLALATGFAAASGIVEAGS